MKCPDRVGLELGKSLFCKRAIFLPKPRGGLKMLCVMKNEWSEWWKMDEDHIPNQLCQVGHVLQICKYNIKFMTIASEYLTLYPIRYRYEKVRNGWQEDQICDSTHAKNWAILQFKTCEDWAIMQFKICEELEIFRSRKIKWGRRRRGWRKYSCICVSLVNEFHPSTLLIITCCVWIVFRRFLLWLQLMW